MESTARERKRKVIVKIILSIAFIIALFVCGAFSAPNVNLVSPYIVRGFSKTYAASYHPETFTGRYEIKISSNSFNRHSDGIDTIKYAMFMETERFNTIGIKDKVEIGFSGFAFPLDPFFSRARVRTVFNIYDKGANDLFANIAISPFLGVSANSVIEMFVIERQNHKNHYLHYGYSHYYCGLSVGTRKLTRDIYFIELFASPSYSITGNANFFDVVYDNISAYISFLTQSLSIPVGFRYIFGKRTVKLSIKSGVGFHFIFNEKEIYTDNYSTVGEINSSYSFNSSYFSAFAEMGLHFGARRINVERRKQLNFEKGGVL